MTTIWKYEVPVDDTVVVDLGRAELVRWLHVEPAAAGTGRSSSSVKRSICR